MSSERSLSRRRRQFLRAGGALAAAAGLDGCLLSTEPYAETADRSFDASEADALAVETESGDVTLTSGDGDAVTGTVRIESRSGRDVLDEVSVDGAVEDGTLLVSPTLPDRDVDLSVDLDLTVPDGLAVERAETTNGDVSATGVDGDGQFRSNNGTVDVESVEGYVAVESSNGDVEAQDATGLAGAETTNGDVDVEVRGVRDDVACESTNGDVTARVPDDLPIAVDLRTVNGDARASDVEVSVTERSDTRLRGTLGGDDPDETLTLRTTNGDVTLTAL